LCCQSNSNDSNEPNPYPPENKLNKYVNCYEKTATINTILRVTFEMQQQHANACIIYIVTLHYKPVPLILVINYFLLGYM